MGWELQRRGRVGRSWLGDGLQWRSQSRWKIMLRIGWRRRWRRAFQREIVSSLSSSMLPKWWNVASAANVSIWGKKYHVPFMVVEKPFTFDVLSRGLSFPSLEDSSALNIHASSAKRKGIGVAHDVL